MKLRLLALAALATVGTAPAHAAATSSASFTDITFELIDLNPADMLAPTITFVTDPGAASYVHAEVSVFDPDNGTDGANLTKTGVRSTTSKSTSVNYGSALAGASVTGGNTTTLSGEGEYTSVISAMSASGGSGSPSAGGNASYNATAQLPYGWWSQNFFLGNNTALLITANATPQRTPSGLTAFTPNLRTLPCPCPSAARAPRAAAASPSRTVSRPAFGAGRVRTRKTVPWPPPF